MIKAAIVSVGRRPVAKLFTASRKIWEAAGNIVSCFGSGLWAESKSWVETGQWTELNKK